MVEWNIHFINKKMIDIIDNYLPEEEFFRVFNHMKEHQFDWHLSTIVNRDGVPGNMQLCHSFHNMHQHKPSTFGIVVPVLRKLNPIALMRIKANLSLATKEVEVGRLHIDIVDDDTPDCVRTSILYMNTNDGYTVFEDGTKVESVMNRFVTFPHTLKHAGTTCTNAPFRMVINFNYVTGNIKE
tara:strand:- start:682 stop:1230 length:549 start_codon:yes stop_codon:yes gene_type:complete